VAQSSNVVVVFLFFSERASCPKASGAHLTVNDKVEVAVSRRVLVDLGDVAVDGDSRDSVAFANVGESLKYTPPFL
jgi:hypothetical protein